MNNVDDLVRTLENHAVATPDATGLVEQARDGAVRVRRRRMALAGASVAALVAAVAVGVPVAVRPDPADPPAETTSAPVRTPSQLTLGLAPVSPFTVIRHGSAGTRQFMLVRNSAALPGARPGTSRNQGGEVFAYDAGSFDPALVRHGERVQVSGRDAYFVRDFPTEARRVSGRTAGVTRAVAWRDPSGAWVVVTHSSHLKADAIEVAEAVTLSPPYDARTPFQFGWVPDGLPVSFVELADAPALDKDATVAFGGGETPPNDVSYPSGPTDPPLQVQAMPDNNRDWQDLIGPRLGTPTQVGGHRTWYLPRPNGQFTGPTSGDDMIVDAGSCIVFLRTADRTEFTREELTRMVANATFGSCTDQAGWLPPVG
jgi:hypothetical protein